jgi:ferritin-like metal-binding protein YciE
MPRTVMSRKEEGIVPIGTMRELFVHELSDAMSAEQQILKMLPELRKEAIHPELTQALKEHEQETKAQIKNLEQVFKQIGEKPEETTCFGVKGLADERQALLEEDPSPEMLEMANVSGAEKSEHYEMVMYTGLIQMAKDLGERDAAQLLQENLDQEKAMAKRVEALAKELSKQAKSREAEQEKETELVGARSGRK